MCVCVMRCSAMQWARPAPVFKFSWSAAVTLVLVVVIDCAFPGFLGGGRSPGRSFYTLPLPGLALSAQEKMPKEHLPASPDSSDTENYGLMIDYSGLILVQTKQMAS